MTRLALTWFTALLIDYRQTSYRKSMRTARRIIVAASARLRSPRRSRSGKRPEHLLARRRRRVTLRAPADGHQLAQQRRSFDLVQHADGQVVRLAAEPQRRLGAAAIVIGSHASRFRPQLLVLVVAAPRHAWGDDVKEGEAAVRHRQPDQLRGSLHVAGKGPSHPRCPDGDRQAA